ncbi:MAG: hypothetical protein V1793_11420, partial [Pseudomonadota bacterium]
ALAVLAAWNFSLMIQYGSRMIVTEGPVTLSEMARNTFVRLPAELAGILHRFLTDRASFR